MRSGGGFRLYAAVYVSLCTFIRDLQLFGYTLEEIKAVSDRVRDFLALSEGLMDIPKNEAGRKLAGLAGAVETLQSKMAELKGGIERWEDLLKKKKKEIAGLKARNAKRPAAEED
jgi:DNA-binding transcriptional MerR regulator